MPGTPTPRLSLPTINGFTDDVSSYPAVNLSQVDILDDAQLCSTGTLAARPAAGLFGRDYYAADTGQWYRDNGTIWTTFPVTGPWQTLTLAGGITAAGGSYVPAGRREGDVVRLRGAVTTGGAFTSAVITTLPGSLWPSATVVLAAAAPSFSLFGAAVSIDTSGVVTVASTFGAFSTSLHLDGMTYTVA